MTQRNVVRRIIYIVAWLAPAWGLVAVATGGVNWMIGPLRVSSRQPLRPIVAGVIAALYYAWRYSRAEIDIDAQWSERWARRASRFIPAAAVLLAIAIAIHYGSFAAAGADSYGYVSQADLWLKGTLRIEQPWVEQMSWPNRGFTFAPLGYRPLSPESGTIVPTYAAGLPILMAAFEGLLGASGPFFVVPILSGIAIWLTYLLGKQITGSGSVGAAAALFLLAAPVFLAQIMLPMTDVPVAGGWTLACVLALREPRPKAIESGLITGATLLVRPNLVLLALAPVSAWLWPWMRHRVTWRATVTNVVLYGIGLLPAVLAVAALNHYLYGSALVSGYGKLTDMYALSAAPENLRRYGHWLLQTQTWLVAVGLVPLAIPTALGHPERTSSARACLAALIVLTLVSYIFYSPFNEWQYLRFLLPAMPALFVLMAAGLRWLTAKLPQPARAPVFSLLCLACLVFGFRFARDQFVFNQRAFEQRYVRAAHYVEELTPPNAVIFAMQHSGSVRYYAHRITLRYDWLYKHRLDTTLRELKEKGYPPYIVLDDWEEREFRKQFAELNRAGRLDWRPMVRVLGSPEVRIYDPAGRYEQPLPGQEVK